MLWAFVFVNLIITGSSLFLSLVRENDTNSLSSMCHDFASGFSDAYTDFLKTGIESQELRELSNQLAEFHSKNVFTVEVDHLGLADQIFMCTTCQAAVTVMVRMFREGGEFDYEHDEQLKHILLDMCLRLKIQNEEVCSMLLDINFPIGRFIVNNTKIDAQSFCGTFLQASFCKVTNPVYNWKIHIDMESNHTVRYSPKSDIPPKGDNDLNILHITDIHYDPLYVVGSLAECGAPECCHSELNVSEGTSKGAGHWGDYRDCDSPWHTIVDTLSQIKERHEKIDYIYHTGDVIDHAVWLTSPEKNVRTLMDINNLLKKTFGDITVFPTIGNHESHPFNLFAPNQVERDDLSTKWLYEFIADLWSVWLPKDTKMTIREGGYYTVSPRPGFRIIALNNNECFVFNWWIIYDGSYLSKQLNWLHDTLLLAEKNKEYVHILGHIPSGSSGCWNVWSREFNRIIVRFRKVISGIFNGHTHRDQMTVYYANYKTPINIAWNGGSLTTFANKNPNYKMYQVEPSSFQVVEHDAWYFNLTAANLEPSKSPEWIRGYRMTEDFNLKDLSPLSIDNMLTTYAEQPDLLRKYWRYYIVHGDPFLREGCDLNCLKKVICILSRADNTKIQRCEELKAKLERSIQNEREN